MREVAREMGTGRHVKQGRSRNNTIADALIKRDSTRTKPGWMQRTENDVERSSPRTTYRRGSKLVK